MVGNDVIMGPARPMVKRTSYSNVRRDYAVSKIHSQTSHQAKPTLPNLFRYMLNATPAVAVVSTQMPVYNAPLLAQNMPSTGISKNKLHISKSMVWSAVVIVVLSGLTAASVLYKQQILTTVKGVRLAAAQHQAAPKPNPRLLVIHNSDYNQAITALMTQQITINLVNSSQSVSPNTIIGWLGISKHSSLTNISVKTNQVISYLNQVAANANGISTGQVNAAANKIANNLLSANGMTVNL